MKSKMTSSAKKAAMKKMEKNEPKSKAGMMKHEKGESKKMKAAEKKMGIKY